LNFRDNFEVFSQISTLWNENPSLLSINSYKINQDLGKLLLKKFLETVSKKMLIIFFAWDSVAKFLLTIFLDYAINLFLWTLILIFNLLVSRTIL